MSEYRSTAEAFLTMAHEIVWCSVATVDEGNRPRSRVLHPIWEWAGDELVGWIATGPTPVKLAHIAHSPHVSLNYWASNHDTCIAECSVEWRTDDATKQRVWDLFKFGPAPVGYDPSIIPPWADGPLTPAFAALRLTPWHLRVFPGTMLLGGAGELLTWTAAARDLDK